MAERKQFSWYIVLDLNSIKRYYKENNDIHVLKYFIVEHENDNKKILWF